MPYAKVVVASIYDVRVEHVTYVEVDYEDLNDDGELYAQDRDSIWQDAINEFCSDTYINIVENEGD